MFYLEYLSMSKLTKASLNTTGSDIVYEHLDNCPQRAETES